MKPEDLSQIKNDFTSFFQQIQDLINDNKLFQEIIGDYIDCKHTIDNLVKKHDKKSKEVLNDYLSLQKDLEKEIYLQLKKNKTHQNYKIRGEI